MWPLLLLACNLGSSPTIAASPGAPGAGSGVPPAPIDNPTAALTPVEGGRYVLGARVVHGNLAVWPVVDTRPSTTGAYVTLADGLARGVVTVTEKDGGTVPTLTVTNQSDRPLFLAAGDVVTGGRQDRVVVADLVIDPHATEAVAVNCVEHGRWSGGASFGYGGRAELGLKQTLEVDKDQGRTWAKVAELNEAKASNLAALGYAADELAPSTGTYRASLEADRVQERALPYQVAVQGALTGDMVVGLVVALEGRVVGAELFGSAALLRQSRDAIARSVALDAVSRSAAPAAPPPDVDATAFLADALSARTAETTATPVGTRVGTDGDQTRGYDLREADGDMVHKSSYRK